MINKLSLCHLRGQVNRFVVLMMHNRFLTTLNDVVSTFHSFNLTRGAVLCRVSLLPATIHSRLVLLLRLIKHRRVDEGARFTPNLRVGLDQRVGSELLRLLIIVIAYEDLGIPQLLLLS